MPSLSILQSSTKFNIFEILIIMKYTWNERIKMKSESIVSHRFV